MSDYERGSSNGANRRASKSQRPDKKYTTGNVRRSSLPEGDFSIDENSQILIPPGTYNVAFVEWWTGVMFNKAKKLGLSFRIIDMGEQFGKIVVRWYNVKRHIGKCGRFGHFQVGRGSAFLADYARLVGMPSRTDRFSLTKLEKVLIQAEVETVSTNHAQQPIIEGLHYSVVRKLVYITMGTTENVKRG